MSSNVNEFVAGVRRDADLPAEEIEKLQRAATLDAFGRLVRRAPVDKGTFRLNWQIGVNDDRPSGWIDKQFDGGSRAANAASASREAHTREAGKVARIRPFTRSWVVNNVPYAEVLEHGNHSDQAPNGFLSQVHEELQLIYG